MNLLNFVIPWWVKWAALGVAIASSFGSGLYWGNRLGEAKLLKYENTVIKQQQEQTTMWQGVINGAVKNYERKITGIRSSLNIALNSLRDRPSRTKPDSSRIDCKGTTGTELSREDAGFLTREAARADTYREGLATCYEIIDGLGKE